jgi:hypothetical protein
MADQPKKTLSLTPPDVPRADDATPAKPEAAPQMSAHGRAISAEEFDELKAQNDDLAAQNQLLSAQFQELMTTIRAQKNVMAAKAPPEIETVAEGETPVLDEDQPYGTVTGDSEVGYVQNGHQFSRDRRYLATEKYRGVPRAFNPRLVGVVRPKAVLQ